MEIYKYSLKKMKEQHFYCSSNKNILVGYWDPKENGIA